MTKCLAWASLFAPAFALVLAACNRSPKTEDAPKTNDTVKSGSTKTPTTEDACSLHATGLERSVPIPRFQPPAGCTTTGHPSLFPQPVTSEAEFGTYYRCAGATSGIDFTNLELWVADGSLSPAETGLEAVDDGRTVTIVQHFRTPCPSDPHPMPTNDVFAFVSTRGATRSFARMQCTVQSKCE